MGVVQGALLAAVGANVPDCFRHGVDGGLRDKDHALNSAKRSRWAHQRMGAATARYCDNKVSVAHSEVALVLLFRIWATMGDLGFA